MRKDINGRSYFTPMDVNPPLYQRVRMHGKAHWLDGVILAIFILGLIATALSL